MKTLLALILFSLLSHSVYADAPFINPDILAQTKVSKDWSKILVAKIKQIFVNFNLQDPFNYEFSNDIILNNIKLDGLVPVSSKNLVSSFSKISGIDLLDVKPIVTISGLRYNVEGLSVNVTNLRKDADQTIIGSDISASKLIITANNLNLSLQLQNSGKEVKILEIDIKDLKIEAKEKDLVKFFADIQVNSEDGFQKFKFLNSNFESVAQVLMNKHDSVDLQFSDFNIKSAKIKLGKSKTIEIKPDQVETLLNENIAGVKGFLISQVAKKLTSGINDVANKIVEKGRLKNEYWVRSKLFSSQYLLSKVTPSDDEQNIEVQFSVNNCMKGRHRAIGEKCIDENDSNKISTRVTPEMLQKSREEIESMINREDANLVASISEDFITKALLSAFKSGKWDDTIKKADVMVGPKKFKVIIEDRSDTATVLVDLIHKNTELERIALPFSHTRFAVSLKVSLKIINVNGVSTAVVKIKSVDTSDAFILKGRPELGFISTIANIGLFEGVVKDKVKGVLNSFVGKELFQHPLPEKLQNLGLEDVSFKGDGLGRMNAFLNIRQILNGQP